MLPRLVRLWRCIDERRRKVLPVLRPDEDDIGPQPLGEGEARGGGLEGEEVEEVDLDREAELAGSREARRQGRRKVVEREGGGEDGGLGRRRGRGLAG